MYSNLDEIISHYSFLSVLIGTGLIIFLSLVSLFLKKPKEIIKKLLFTGICLTTILVTLFLGGSTVYLNTVSSSKGPVHHHSDIEFWACGEELNLKDPEGTFSNKIGTPTLHEHNDKRIHIEGVIVTPLDASLGKFMQVVGGTINSEFVVIPTNEGSKKYITGEACPNGQTGKVQVFVYKTINGEYSQEKLMDPKSHILSPYSSVPSGDCIIVEFDSEKDATDKLCLSYEVAEKIGKIKRSGNQ